MLICPNCRNSIDKDISCSRCNWQYALREGIANYLKTKLSHTIKHYIECYDQISNDDLRQTILPKDYLQFQAEKLLFCLPKDKSAKICDVGGGQGFLVQACKDKGYKDITVVDIAIPYLKKLADRFKCFIAEAENLPFEQEFDVMFATDIIEHVLNPGSFMFCAHKSLKKDGLLVLRAPYLENLMSYSPHLGCKYDFVHLRTFDEKTIKKTMRDAGFIVKNIYYDGYWYGTHRDFLKNRFLIRLYMFICRKITSTNYIKNNALFKNFFCRLFIKPAEIVCVAQKRS